MFKRKNKQPNKLRSLITQLNPRSPISEQYKTVRTNLQFSSVDQDMQSILLTSAGQAEGKSLTAANLAVVYAQQGKKTLLIDADLRKPTVHYTFRLDNLTGLSNVLIGSVALENSTTATDVENLDVLTCGPIPPNPSELLASKKMRDMLEHAKKLYDCIIFDSPPILAVADAKILANIVDGTIFIVRSAKTKAEEAEKGIELIKDTQAKFLGVVLNDYAKSKNDYYYYYGA